MSEEKEDLIKENGKNEFQIETCIKIKDGDSEKPTDAYGSIEFIGTTKDTLGKYVRLSDETDPGVIYQLMTEEWRVAKPSLLISVTGGTKSLYMHPTLKLMIKNFLANVANTPGTWVVSGGTNTGVMKLIGDALHGTNNTLIGIVPWGVIAKRDDLVATEDRPAGGTFPYHQGSYLRDFLADNHSHFLLVDDGSVGKYGGEKQLRAQFEEYVMKSTPGNVPTVLLVLEGGLGILHTVYTSVTNRNIPCVIVKGTGKTADLLAFAMENCNAIAEYNGPERKYPKLMNMIKKTFSNNDANEIYDKIRTMLSFMHLLTVADIQTDQDGEYAILAALLNDTDRKISSYQLMKFTILWDRADLAEIPKWEESSEGDVCKELQWLMIMALAMNRIGCVKLLLDYEVNIEGLLTIEVLEFLYAYRSLDEISTLKNEVKPTKYAPHNAGSENAELFEELLSYASVDKKYCSLPRNVVQGIINRLCRNLIPHRPNGEPYDILEVIEPPNRTCTFKYPFRELFFWAVLNNMLDMAKYLLAFEQEFLGEALIAAEISRSLSARCAHLETKRILAGTASTFKKLAYQLLDSCYQENENLSKKYITSKLEQLSVQCPDTTCLDLAVRSWDMEFLSHDCVQGIIDDVWTGSINRNIEGRKILWAFFFPFLLYNMDIREEDEEQNDKRSKRLPLYKKMYLFYFHSPMVKFYMHSAGYIFFMMLFAYTAMLKRTSPTVTPLEYVVLATVLGFLVGEIYQIIHFDGPTIGIKLSVYISDFWNRFDCLCVLFFIIAITLRSFEETCGIGHVLYAIDCSLWIIRWLEVLLVYQSGPYVVMIGYLFSDTMYFLAILVVFLVSYGIGMTAILKPGPPDWQMFVYSIFRSYFNMHGELFIDRDKGNNETTRFGTPYMNSYSEPIGWIYLAVYLFIANVLLLNLLIAVFNNTYEEAMTYAAKMQDFERYGLVLEYAQQRIALFPPFSLLGHIFYFFRWLFSDVKKPKAKFKTELNYEKKERLKEFERKCLVKLLSEQQNTI